MFLNFKTSLKKSLNLERHYDAMRTKTDKWLLLTLIENIMKNNLVHGNSPKLKFEFLFLHIHCKYIKTKTKCEAIFTRMTSSKELVFVYSRNAELQTNHITSYFLMAVFQYYLVHFLIHFLKWYVNATLSN